jgi:hypothetical protein
LRPIPRTHLPHAVAVGVDESEVVARTRALADVLEVLRQEGTGAGEAALDLFGESGEDEIRAPAAQLLGGRDRLCALEAPLVPPVERADLVALRAARAAELVGALHVRKRDVLGRLAAAGAARADPAAAEEGHGFDPALLAPVRLLHRAPHPLGERLAVEAARDDDGNARVPGVPAVELAHVAGERLGTDLVREQHAPAAAAEVDLASAVLRDQLPGLAAVQPVEEQAGAAGLAEEPRREKIALDALRLDHREDWVIGHGHSWTGIRPSEKA